MGGRTFYIRGGIALAVVGLIVFGAFRSRRPPLPKAVAAPALAPASTPVDTKKLEVLALALQAQGDFAAAEAFFRQCLEYRTRVLGPANNDTLAAMKNLANLLHARGKDDEAAALYEKVREGLRKTRGASGSDTPVIIDELPKSRKAESFGREADPKRP